LNAVFEPQCYIATENGQKRPNFGGGFFRRFLFENTAASKYGGYFGAFGTHYLSAVGLPVQKAAMYCSNMKQVTEIDTVII